MARFFTLILAAALLVACGPSRLATPQPLPTPTPLPPDQPVDSRVDIPAPSPAPYLPQESDNTLRWDIATVESKDILTLEMFPPQYILALKGNMPTICHQLRVRVSEPDARKDILVEVYSVTDPNKVCAQQLAPFEVSIGLKNYAKGTYHVLVNGETAGKIEIAGAAGIHSMKGFELYSWQSEGEWHFSLLTGTNRLKTVDEMKDPDTTLKSVEALKDSLKKIAPGEFVVWLAFRKDAGLSLPPEEVIEDIRAYCTQQGLRFDLVAP